VYTYNAAVAYVVDGDTVDIMIDLGFRNFTKQRVRLAGIDAPEKNTEAGVNSKAWLVEQLIDPVTGGRKVVVKSEKPGAGDKYGRYLATIYLPELLTFSINEALVAAGHAFVWDGTSVQPAMNREAR